MHLLYVAPGLRTIATQIFLVNPNLKSNESNIFLRNI